MRRAWVVLAVVAVGTAVWFGVRSQRMEVRARAAEERARQAEGRLQTMGDPRVFLREDELRELRDVGLTDPVRQLRSDLEAHGSLIPIPAVLGGTMGFHDRGGVILLPGGYVYAPAEDGHIAVHTLLRYDVAPGGAIRWKLLDATKDE